MTNEFFNRETYQKDDIIFNEGDAAFHVFIVESGEVEIHKKNGDHMVKIATLTKGGLFGEMALVDNTTRSATAIAGTNCTCIRIPALIIEHNLKSCPPIIQSILKILAQNLRRTTAKSVENSSMNQSDLSKEPKSEEKKQMQG
jgi:CRP/FNR family cyclic AMP-dependent transcriptional regulator